jgi:hypothetical protein
MAYHIPPTSPVITKLLAPLLDAYSGSLRKYACTALGDLDFLESGISRCLSAVTSGRDFLQQHADKGRKDIERTLFFKALKSGRRLANLVSVNLNVARLMGSRLADPLAGIEELSGFDIFAGDGHFHEAACHDPHKLKKPKPAKKKANGDRQKRAKKLQTGHFFMLGMRDHHLRHHALAELRPGGGNEHDMHALKRVGAKALRFGAKVGRKVMIVWDRACIDFGFWEESKRLGVYFISREKANMAIQVIVLLFKQRWDIEKVFDEVKNKMLERKSWASSKMAKEMHANFTCLTHNLMMLLEDEIEKEDEIGNAPERKRKSERLEEAKESGAGYVATMMQRFTVRSVKFVRWLRNFIYRDAPWGDALARLAKIYSTR